MLTLSECVYDNGASELPELPEYSENLASDMQDWAVSAMGVNSINIQNSEHIQACVEEYLKEE